MHDDLPDLLIVRLADADVRPRRHVDLVLADGGRALIGALGNALGK